MGYIYYDPDGQKRRHTDAHGEPKKDYVVVQTLYGQAQAVPVDEARRLGLLR